MQQFRVRTPSDRPVHARTRHNSQTRKSEVHDHTPLAKAVSGKRVFWERPALLPPEVPVAVRPIEIELLLVREDDPRKIGPALEKLCRKDQPCIDVSGCEPGPPAWPSAPHVCLAHGPPHCHARGIPVELLCDLPDPRTGMFLDLPNDAPSRRVCDVCGFLPRLDAIPLPAGSRTILYTVVRLIPKRFATTSDGTPSRTSSRMFARISSGIRTPLGILRQCG